MKYQYHKDGTLPKNGEVFVFGSNLAGIHGAGAAQVAAEKFGARYGLGYWRFDRSFAIPTKGHRIETLSESEIRQFVRAFLDEAHRTPETQYFVTRIGCGLAGYKDSDIAPMFRGAPTNCNFAEQWKEYLE